MRMKSEKKLIVDQNCHSKKLKTKTKIKKNGPKLP